MELIACTTCKSKYIPPKYTCPQCGSTGFHSVEVDGNGVIESFTTIWVAPERFMDQVPYHVIMVKLDEGIRVTGRLADSPEGLVIDSRVTFVEKSDIGYEFRLI